LDKGNRLMHAIKQFFNKRSAILKRAVIVALIVGSILNVVNQWDYFWAAAPLDWLHFIANFMVPFCVSYYSGASAQKR
jgi:hypothetical protein